MVSALIDGLDLVAVITAGSVPEAMSQARQRGCVLLPTASWPSRDLTIERLEQRGPA